MKTSETRQQLVLLLQILHLRAVRVVERVTMPTALHHNLRADAINIHCVTRTH